MKSLKSIALVVFCVMAIVCVRSACAGPATEPAPLPPNVVPHQNPQTGKWQYEETNSNTETLTGTAPSAKASGASSAAVAARAGTAPDAHLSDVPGGGHGGGATGGTATFDDVATAAATSNETRWALGIIGALIIAGGWVGFKVFPLSWSLKYALEATAAGAVCIVVAVLWAHLLVALLIAFGIVLVVLVFEILHGSGLLANVKTAATAAVNTAESKAASAIADATSIVKSIDVVRSDPTVGPAVQAAMQKLKPNMQLVQTPGAQALVKNVAHT